MVKSLMFMKVRTDEVAGGRVWGGGALTSAGVLHDQVQGLFSLDHLKQLDCNTQREGRRHGGHADNRNSPLQCV